MTFRAEHVVLVSYAILLIVGGVMGYVKARSRASLVSGLLSGVGALLAATLSMSKVRWGVPLGALLAVSLFVVFGYRYAIRSNRFMPSGMIAVLSLVVLLLLFAMADWSA